MANEWINTNNAACYDTDIAGYSLAQDGVMTVGQLYLFEFTITNMTQGKIIIPSLSGSTEFTENGTYSIIGVALIPDLLILPLAFGGGVFDGCVDVVELAQAPYYTIYDENDVAVFTLTDGTGVTGSDGYVQYQIDWSDLDEGNYYIQFNEGLIIYRTDCFYVKNNHDCSVQITWNCNEDAWGFNYNTLSFTQTLRIDAKLWQRSYKATDKEVYEFSNGDLKINYVSKAFEDRFTTERLPEYIHNALNLALDSDSFFIDGNKYVFEDEDYSPSWTKASNLASVEVILRQKQNLRNVNCR